MKEVSMKIQDVMTTNPTTCKPSDTLDIVAKLMLEHDCGEIPVCDGSMLAGVITDRDITCRAVATGKTPVAIPVRDVMTRTVFSVHENDSLDHALDLMQEKLVRRLPVVDANNQIIGIVSQADLVAKLPTLKVARLVKSVSKKTRQHARAAL
jgi:CBS domain-containing protein